jgi:nicotinate-nucleotide--dimethylbenzimidazole phosphoribosyltransferase
MEKILIPIIDTSIQKAVQETIDNKTKPVGSLGILEDIVLQIAKIQGTTNPKIKNPTILVFAGDHGIAAEGVSAYPSSVTYQMVLNFLSGGAAINVFCRQNNIDLKIIDSGVAAELPESNSLYSRKIGFGTKDFLHEPAMTSEQLEQALKAGMEIAEEIIDSGCNTIGFGEMGIGNSTSAAVLLSAYTGLSPEFSVGHGTGISEPVLLRKRKVVTGGLNRIGKGKEPLEILAELGGFEIAMMAGAMIKTAEKKCTIVVDGFISSAAFLAAWKWNPEILPYAIFAHKSQEQGHKFLLEHIGVKPMLDFSLRLGEGTGAALAFPLLQSALSFYDEMASFSSAGVDKKNI